MTGDVWQHSGMTWPHWYLWSPHPEYWLIVASTLDTGYSHHSHRATYAHCSQHLTKTIDMLSLYRSWIVHWMCNRKKSELSLCLWVIQSVRDCRLVRWRKKWQTLDAMIPSWSFVMDKCEWVYLGRIAVRCNGGLIVWWEAGHGDEGWEWCQQ